MSNQFYLWDMVENRPLNAAYTSLSEANEARKMYSNPDRYGVMTGKFEEATRETPPAKAGKPATITAKEFVEQGYAEKVKRGECVVYWNETELYDISSSNYEGLVTAHYDAFCKQHSVISVDTPLIVQWLTPPQPATAQVANETAEGSGADEFDELKHLTSIVEAGLQWDAVAAQRALHILLERYENQQAELSALRDQNAKLRAALEQIASKSDPERPKKWDAEMDTSFGITLGWWSAGQIARKTLDDLRKAAKEGEG